jgi:hypothetical protein
MVKQAWPEANDYDLETAMPWDRQPHEPARAYEAFRLYRDMPPVHRKLQDLEEKTGLSYSRLRAFVARWEWRDRANAWDEACHKVEDKERLEAIRSMHAIHRQAGRAALAKAVQALSYLQAEAMPPSVIARLLELGAKLERSTLITSVEELQGIEIADEDEDDPWERIARELDHNPQPS